MAELVKKNHVNFNRAAFADRTCLLVIYRSPRRSAQKVRLDDGTGL
jgi:hypothetical protein